MLLIELTDPGTFRPVSDGLAARDPLGFPGYGDALEAAAAKSGLDEAVVCGPAAIGGYEVELALFSFAFMGGSMGEVVGERLARALERATDRRVPFVLATATGGARMQEGMRALVQMPKLVSARRALAQARVPYIAVLGNPTTGGVLASLGALADVTIAEAGATIGFAGPRVARAATGRPLSARSHSAESAYDHGLVDALAPRDELAGTIARALDVLAPDDPEPVTADPPSIKGSPPDAWAAISAARRPQRARAPELARAMCSPSFELRGDRVGSADPALYAALGRVLGRRCLVLALDREHAPGPGAYRSARRVLAIATRLELPVVTLIDTRGADPGEDSEAGGIAWEIAATFEALLSAPVPVVAVVTGEGGSGGALALACGDLLYAYQGAVFSVIAPELAAEILWRDVRRADEAARLLKPSAPDLAALGIADGLLPEPPEPHLLARVVAGALDRLAGRSFPADRLARWRSV
jgi:acetyl-CoA carboxylase carboxyl transferase subunit beta